MSMNGPYSDLIRNSRNSSLVKKCFMDIHTYYRRFDSVSLLLKYLGKSSGNFSQTGLRNTKAIVKMVY